MLGVRASPVDSGSLVRSSVPWLVQGPSAGPCCRAPSPGPAPLCRPARGDGGPRQPPGWRRAAPTASFPTVPCLPRRPHPCCSGEAEAWGAPRPPARGWLQDSLQLRPAWWGARGGAWAALRPWLSRRAGGASLPDAAQHPRVRAAHRGCSLGRRIRGRRPLRARGGRRWGFAPSSRGQRRHAAGVSLVRRPRAQQ